MDLPTSPLFGREEEIAVLDQLCHSKQSEFLAVYGRRRVGKTFLIHEYFHNKGLYFAITGRKKTPKRHQIGKFYDELCALFPEAASLTRPKTWEEALDHLHKMVQGIPKTQKIILFFDEVPWLSGNRSGFLAALEYYWNLHFSKYGNVLLVICGSSASWMIRKIVHDKGGLHGRLSRLLHLRPFNLAEHEAFLRERGVQLERRELIELYMLTGGVPKYLTYVMPGKSAAQIIDELCFTSQGPLLSEFQPLYASLFDSAHKHIAIVKELAKKRYGLTREALLKHAGLPNGGGSSLLLDELEASDFILKALEWGKKVKESRFRLIDAYSFFYLHFIEPVKSQVLQGGCSGYFMQKQNGASWASWSGYAFENVCLLHVGALKKALGIQSVLTEISHWASPSEEGEDGVEIDLVLDRADRCIHLFEFKFSREVFVVDKDYARVLEHKKQTFRRVTDTRKTVFLTLVTPFGLKHNQHSLGVVDQVLTLDSLFS